MKEFNAMMGSIPGEVHHQLKFGAILRNFIQVIHNAPNKSMKQTIEQFIEFNLPMEEEKKAFATILALMDDKMPEETGKEEMTLAYKLGNMNLLKNLFNEWLTKGFTVNDLTSFIKQANTLEKHPPFIEYMIVAVWNTENQAIKNIREDLIKIILNNVKWDNRDFLKKNNPKDLVAFISKSSGFFNQVLSKLFKK